uniref:Uncharacterized protein n=1 Tax=Desmodus rotundus TaxID=9430 RepID=K9IFR2_DESRO
MHLNTAVSNDGILICLFKVLAVEMVHAYIHVCIHTVYICSVSFESCSGVFNAQSGIILYKSFCNILFLFNDML